MSTQTPIIKRHNHAAYRCLATQKASLLTHLLDEHKDKRVAVVGAPKEYRLSGVTYIEDEDLATAPRVDLIISYTLPATPELYMARLDHTDLLAFILLDESDNSLLYEIERQLGKAIRQEQLEGFGSEQKKKKPMRDNYGEKPRKDKKSFASKRSFDDGKKFEKKSKPWEKRSNEPIKEEGGYKKKYAPRDFDDDSNEESRREYKPRNNARGDSKPWEKRDGERGERKPFEKRDGEFKKSYPPRDREFRDGDKKPWENKPKRESKYIGKDENGKPMFSGKSGERNHRFDGKPKDFSNNEKTFKKEPKRFDIKGKKPKEE
ncbi:MAG: hypothetical protein IE916_10525 [Epsilonproteobacteria bacterium]|nr:hypothetical protein [Campylobacterota bacterium]